MAELNNNEENNLINPLNIEDNVQTIAETDSSSEIDTATEENQSDSNESAMGGVDANTAALICYLFLLFGGVIFYLLEKKDPFVRFAAMQSIILGAVIIGLFIILRSLSFIAPTIFGILTVIFSIGAFSVWAILMYKSFNGQELELPIIGRFAREAISKK